VRRRAAAAAPRGCRTPVDERAVAVEGQHVEAVEVQIGHAPDARRDRICDTIVAGTAQRDRVGSGTDGCPDPARRG
jgi:hypothetical protein